MNDGQQKESFYINSDQYPPQAPNSADMGMQQAFHINGPMHPHPQFMQQHHNEYLLHAPQHNYTAPQQPESYSVLPVGHGNFLKVYHHCPDNLGNLNDGSGMMGGINQQFHHPQQSPLHMGHPQAHAPVQIFDSYELFSSPSLMPIHIAKQQQQQQQQQQTRMATDLVNVRSPIVDTSNSFMEERTPQSCSTNQTTNMIINKLVNNWSSGGTYTQFGAPLPTQINVSMDNKDFATNTPPAMPVVDVNINNVLPINNVVEGAPNTATSANVSSARLSNAAKAPVGETLISSVQSDTVGNSSGTSSFAPQEVKKRIVAEVKPMRMTYSDVLSKVNNNQSSAAQSLSNNNKQFGPASQFRESKGFPDSKVFPESSHNNSFRRAAGEEHGSSHARGSMKKSPTHENKENVSSISKQGKRTTVSSPNLVSTPTNSNTVTVNSGIPPTQKSSNAKQTNGNNSSKKRTTKREPTVTGDATKTQKPTTTEKDSNAFYNVTAKRNVNPESVSKTVTSNGIGNNTSARSKQNVRGSSSSSNVNSSNTSSSYSSNQSRFARYTTNGSATNAYSYSSKRNRSGINFSASAATNRNYELAKKLFHTWLQFMLKVLTWLYHLVYDIVVLGFSMVYDRLSHAAIEFFAYVKQLHRDLKQNSNKPGVWIKSAWRRFDARFKKNSKFAFWRYFYKKKPPEPTTESFKQGRLPQTGEEAMYSLLNCKGKDAYSILGVPPDSSQEQIRKHYKKIAVLVHPDKNKQAGSEEAFKVLQRAFELIGEPDKRHAYDQSLAEALHAEKAWSELHDLLSQLQTKITEAASTIRCSTCGLRHPRRLVDRPPYAARECATCKIRHSAREGDIWAETSFMGLRWKYLALMEGKVYDITEWANCQKGALAHLEPNSHLVQYRIVRGAQQQQQQQQQNQQYQEQQQQQQQSHPHSPHHQFGNGMFKHDFPSSEASLHDFLDNLYSGQNPNNSNTSAYSGSSRRRNRRN